MIAMLGLLAWTALFMLVCYVSWTKIILHIKVYLLIIYNAVYLTGVFYLFPYLKN